ncbi:MAG TPA: glycerol-3-phosphate 1-O-acyltransferase PlsY [Bacteroidales bacterium]|nr:glycerol-3-phosphate 1-O-acyltransferase PlsY [Bacteroidales bacterium]
MISYFPIVSGAVIAYLMGSFSSSVWIGRAFFSVDVRDEGSHNAGATNTIRVLGVKAGIIVLLLDALKGWGAVALSALFAGSFFSGERLVYYKILAGLMAVLGHVFPVYTGFRGGKGVATLVGVVVALFPKVFWIVLVWFFTVFLATGYVSLASVTSAILLPFISFFIFHEKSMAIIVLSILIAVFIPVTHHKNIRRLIRGEESKLKLWKKKP